MKNIILSSIIGVAMLTSASAQEDNLIKNGDFAKKSAQPWKIFGIKKAQKPEVTINNGEITLSVKVPALAVSNRQMSQGPIQMKSNTKYKLIFDTKSEATPEEIQVFLTRSKNHKDGHYGLRKKVAVTTKWKTQTIYFSTKSIDPADPPTFKFLIGNVKKSISLRNISLQEAKGNASKASKK